MGAGCYLGRSFGRLLWLAGLGLALTLACSDDDYGQAPPADELSIEGVMSLVEGEGVRSVAELLELLPERQLGSFVLMRESGWKCIARE